MTPKTNKTTDFSTLLKEQSAFVRVHQEKMGLTRTLDRKQISDAAEIFSADPRLLQAGKKLFDTAHPCFRAITKIRNEANFYWRRVTTPFPETGVRLIRRDRIEQFEARMQEYRTELGAAVAELQAQYKALVAEAKSRLGKLFNPNDYPASVEDQFVLDWDYPSFEPPDYLKQISPELWQQQQQRMAARFDEAVALAEQAFVAEISKLVTHLVERLTGDRDGKPKVFRDSAVKNLDEFFARFKDLSIGSNAELDKLITKARKIVSGADPESLRSDTAFRAKIAADLKTVADAADKLMIKKPSRRIDLDDKE